MRTRIVVGLLVLSACGGNERGGRDGSSEGGACASGEVRCDGTVVQRCFGGELQPQEDCADAELMCVEGEGCLRCTPGETFCSGQELFECNPEGSGESLVEVCAEDLTCVPGRGCLNCRPGERFCSGQQIFECGEDGSSRSLVDECAAGLFCRAGSCTSACAAAERNRNNVGCDYMVVDLDNEFNNLIGGTPPAQEQLAVVIANTSPQSTEALVYQSNGQPNAPVEALIQTVIVPANGLVRIDLPARELDGSTTTVEGPGTMLTNNAYRIRTNFPVVAYQFNPIIESASNDASLLMPVAALDTRYRILGYPTANPIEFDIGPDIAGIPDHSYVTIVGTEPGTNVRVTLGSDIVAGERQGGGTIPAARAGETVEFVIGPYDVLNLESDGIPGDMSGTVVEASAPVAVFSGGERALIGSSPLPNHPSGVPDDVCCTEHLEEQVFPTSTWGTNFRVSRSPVRTDHPTWREPDLYRLIADQDGTVVETSLPAPFDRFTLSQNEWVEFHADTSFQLTSNLPINLAQYLVSQGWVVSWKPGHGGDPSMIYIPPVEQFREDYVVLVPETFSTNYVVVTGPEGTNFQIDDVPASCTNEPVGDASYTAFFCELGDGSHRIEADQPVAVLGYGYHNVGSYGYAAGANLTRINLL